MVARPTRICRTSAARLAAGLAELIDRGVPFSERPELALGQFARDRDALFPVPHSSLFDFEATAKGAEWIDAHARRARAVLDEPAGQRPVVGHDDWRVEHVRFDGDRIVAVYDWASLKAMPETSIVGSTSHAYGVDLTTPGARSPTVTMPSRSSPTTSSPAADPSRKRSAVASTRTGCTRSRTAQRCEHSLLATTVDPVPHGFRDRLADHGACVLA